MTKQKRGKFGTPRCAWCHRPMERGDEYTVVKGEICCKSSVCSVRIELRKSGVSE